MPSAHCSTQVFPWPVSRSVRTAPCSALRQRRRTTRRSSTASKFPISTARIPSAPATASSAASRQRSQAANPPRRPCASPPPAARPMRWKKKAAASPLRRCRPSSRKSPSQKFPESAFPENPKIKNDQTRRFPHVLSGLFFYCRTYRYGQAPSRGGCQRS